MEKTKKILRKLGKTKRNKLRRIAKKLELNDLEGLDIKKLRGYKNLYRIRFGNIRVIFVKAEGKNIIADIDYRNKIYKNL